MRLAAHDGDATTFQRILAAHALADPALAVLGALVAGVVAHVMHDRDYCGLAPRHPLAGGVLAVAEGTMLLSADDGACLARSLPIYDALYARLTAQREIERHSPSPPASVLEQTLQVARATDRLRQARTHFSGAAFAAALHPPEAPPARAGPGDR